MSFTAGHLVGILILGLLVGSVFTIMISPPREVEIYQEIIQEEVLVEVEVIKEVLVEVEVIKEVPSEVTFEQEEKISELYNLLKYSVVSITGINQEDGFYFPQPGIGTGFFVTPTCVVTNAHVLEDEENGHLLDKESIEIILPIESSDRYYYVFADIVKIGSANGGLEDGSIHKDDLAVLEITDWTIYYDVNDKNGDFLSTTETDMTFSPLPVTFNTNTPEVGSIAFTIGHPENIGYWIPITGQFLQSTDWNEFQFSITSFGGNSGGPIFNLDGELIGVVWGSDQDVIRYNNMDPSRTLKEIIWEENLGRILYKVGFDWLLGEKSSTLESFLSNTQCAIN